MQLAMRSSLSVSKRCFCSTSRYLAEISSEPAQAPESNENVSAPLADETSSSTPGAAADQSIAAEPENEIKATGKIHHLNKTAWLAGPGKRYERPAKGRPNWIGETPFPMNPTFLPRPPLSDNFKDIIFKDFRKQMTDKLKVEHAPKEGQAFLDMQNVALRNTAQAHNVSMERAKAVIRLKVHEQQWVKEGQALQSEFSKGMESILGVEKASSSRRQKFTVSEDEPSGPSFNERAHEPADGIKPVFANSKQIFEFVDVERGEESLLAPLLAKKKSSSSSSTSSFARPVSNRVVNKNKSHKPALIVTDVSKSEQSLAWERSNTNRSASERVKRERQVAGQEAQRQAKVAWSS